MRPVALRSLVRRALGDRLSQSFVGSVDEGATLGLIKSRQEIALNRIRTPETVVYVSPVAHYLAAQRAQPVKAIAHDLATQLMPGAECFPHASNPDLATRLWHHCRLRTTPTALIEITVGDRGLALWLQQSIEALSLLGLTPAFTMVSSSALTPADESIVWAGQMAHARCCSLLGLAAREGLIQLVNDGDRWHITQPTPVPWMADETTLWLHHPAERALLTHLIDTMDDLVAQTPLSQTRVLKWIERLALAVQQFDRACRLFGEVRQTQLPLVQARLGVLLIGRSLLESLLKHGLQVAAPTAL